MESADTQLPLEALSVSELETPRAAPPSRRQEAGGGSAGEAGALEDVKKLSTDQGSSRMAANFSVTAIGRLAVWPVGSRKRSH